MAVGLPAVLVLHRVGCVHRCESKKLAAEGKKVVFGAYRNQPRRPSRVIASDGILTARVAFLHHAALVARQMGKVLRCRCW